MKNFLKLISLFAFFVSSCSAMANRDKESLLEILMLQQVEKLQQSSDAESRKKLKEISIMCLQELFPTEKIETVRLSKNGKIIGFNGKKYLLQQDDIGKILKDLEASDAAEENFISVNDNNLSMQNLLPSNNLEDITENTKMSNVEEDPNNSNNKDTQQN